MLRNEEQPETETPMNSFPSPQPSELDNPLAHALSKQLDEMRRVVQQLRAKIKQHERERKDEDQAKHIWEQGILRNMERKESEANQYYEELQRERAAAQHTLEQRDSLAHAVQELQKELEDNVSRQEMLMQEVSLLREMVADDRPSTATDRHRLSAATDRRVAEYTDQQVPNDDTQSTASTAIRPPDPGQSNDAGNELRQVHEALEPYNEIYRLMLQCKSMQSFTDAMNMPTQTPLPIQKQIDLGYYFFDGYKLAVQVYDCLLKYKTETPTEITDDERHLFEYLNAYWRDRYDIDVDLLDCSIDAELQEGRDVPFVPGDMKICAARGSSRTENVSALCVPMVRDTEGDRRRKAVVLDT